MNKEEILIHTEYITLVQLCKLADLISSGGEMKPFMSENKIYYNGEIETRLRKKIYPGDSVTVLETVYLIKSK